LRPNFQPIYQQGTACSGSFPEHHGTIFHGTQGAVALIVRVRAGVAEG